MAPKNSSASGTRSSRRSKGAKDVNTASKKNSARTTRPASNRQAKAVPQSYGELDSDSTTESDSEEGKSNKKTRQTRKRGHTEEDEEDYSTVKVYDSDALDEDSDTEVPKSGSKRKSSMKSSPKKTASPHKKRKKDTEETEDEYELEEGQEIVGVVVQAPKTGRVAPGMISKNTFDFLAQLKDPKCNDREWFKLREPVYRVAEKEWKDFVESFTDILTEVDSQIPHLPPKDLIHRIYRDVRFSNDKTPYKKHLSATFSRSGRKGIFAGYHVSIQPGNKSVIGAGSWCPGRNELATLRSNIQRNSRRLRNVISAPEFVKFFGEAKPHPKGGKQNIFGNEDELKTAPKGVGKDHKDIDLLKCRSFAVFHSFTDSEVLSPNFKESLAEVARVMQPLVHCLNDMMTILGGDDDDEEDGEEGEEEGASDEE